MFNVAEKRGGLVNCMEPRVGHRQHGTGRAGRDMALHELRGSRSGDGLRASSDDRLVPHRLPPRTLPLRHPGRPRHRFPLLFYNANTDTLIPVSKQICVHSCFPHLFPLLCGVDVSYTNNSNNYIGRNGSCLTWLATS